MKNPSEYYQANKESIKAKALAYYYTNRDKRLKYSKEYYLANKGNIQEYRSLIMPKTRCRKEKPPKIPRVCKQKPQHMQQKQKAPAPPKFAEASYIISFE
jgi:hypothetical protein